MFWNKINVDTEIHLSSPMYLEIENTVKLNIEVDENIDTKLVIIGNSDYDININLNENSSLLVNSINKNNSVNVEINLNEKSVITYNHSTLSKNDSINNFKVNHITSNSTSNLNNNGINLSSNKLFFNIDGIVKKNLSNIVCNQSSKIINFNLGESKIIPNLIIDSNDIIANHSAYIGEIGEEEKFYLKSRGINEEDIKKIIYKAILLGKMELKEEEEEFNKRINEWW
jgi:Fe-S cluster assembly scaffold protein SufB